MVRYQYSRWDGSQQVVIPSDNEALSHIFPHLLECGDVSEAVQRTVRRGTTGEVGERVAGLDELLERLQALKRGILQRYDLASVVERLDDTLRDIMSRERESLRKRLEEVRARYEEGEGDEGLSPDEQKRLLEQAEEAVRRAEAFLDRLPKRSSRLLKELQRYHFTDEGSRKRFNRLLRSLQRKALESAFGKLPQSVRAFRPRGVEELRGMLHDMNGLLEGEGSFDDFIARYGDFFAPSIPRNSEEMLAFLRERMAHMQALRRSLPAKLRRELDEALQEAFSDPRLRREMGRLFDNMSGLDALPDSLPFEGDEPLGLEQALKQIGRVQDIERLEAQFRKAKRRNDLRKVSRTLVESALGEGAVRDLQRLSDLTSSLERVGHVQRLGGEYRLTARGIRALGERALREVFASVEGMQFGGHPTESMGVSGDPVEETRPYEFGAGFDLHLQRSLTNALRRGVMVPLKLDVRDMEVRVREQTSRAATVLVVDLSLSMAMRGNFPIAKKVALALEALIRTRYPQDSLRIVGFSTHARQISPESLPFLTWDEEDAFTNVQGGLTLARRLLARMPAEMRQIILVSDGEPTAHMEWEEVVCNFPSTSKVLDETLREVKRCTRQGITINTFMLDGSARLAKFVERMARINRGRVFFTDPARLGRYLLVDYVASRRLFLS